MAEDDKRSEDPALPSQTRADVAAEAEVIDQALQTPPPPARRRGGGGLFLGGLLGGVLAAAAGFGLARLVPGGWPLQDTSALEAQIAAQGNDLAALRADLAALEARPVPDASEQIVALQAGLEERLAQVPAADPAQAEATAALQSALAALDARLTELEKRPAGGGAASSSALAAFERELQALRDQIAAQNGQGGAAAAQIEQVAAEAKAQLAAAAQEAERLKAEAAATAQAAAISAALGRIRAAIEAGGPYEGALADLTAAGIAVPAELADHAASGVPTLAVLQQGFPSAARDALTAALRAEAPTGWGDRAMSFLRAQTGARSLTPRDGDDPDAILSRAEAKLGEGDLPGALAELATLPEPAQQAMAPWVAQAQIRQKATEAAVALTASAGQ
jgi:hypothetical protein